MVAASPTNVHNVYVCRLDHRPWILLWHRIASFGCFDTPSGDRLVVFSLSNRFGLQMCGRVSVDRVDSPRGLDANCSNVTFWRNFGPPLSAHSALFEMLRTSQVTPRFTQSKYGVFRPRMIGLATKTLTNPQETRRIYVQLILFSSKTSIGTVV
jgi:hypothetical protein